MIKMINKAGMWFESNILPFMAGVLFALAVVYVRFL